MLTVIVTIALLLLLLLLPFLLLWTRSSLPAGCRFLPGPKPKPIVGNLLDIPQQHSWFQFEEWGKQYGPLFRVNILGGSHVIICNESIANDLLRERGNIYSSRAQLPMAGQLLSKNLRPVFLPYGETWRNARKFWHHFGNVKAVKSYQSQQEKQSLRAVRDLLQDPSQYEKWFERYSTGLVLKLAYSKDVYTGDEIPIKQVLSAVHNLERVATPGAYLVDSLPILMYLPSWLAPFKREAERLHQNDKSAFRALLQEGISSGEKNFSSIWAEDKDRWKLSDDLATFCISAFSEAGGSTTAAAMMNFLLVMVLHRKELLKLQEELDQVVGSSRIPNFQDIPNLPRIRAIAKEVLRWRPVTAGGLPHLVEKDDVYVMDGQKYFIPAGSLCHPVQWAIHRDADMYPEPEEFLPARWVEPGWPTYKEPLTIHPNLQQFSAFGHGRRICPGLNLAENSMYILIARIAWACDIGKRIDPNGVEMTPPSYDYCTGFNVQPNPFSFSLKVRSKRHHGLVEESYQEIWGSSI